MNYDEAAGTGNTQSGVNASPEYDPFYRFTGHSEEEFFQPEHDHITGAYTADGLLYLTSALDETASREFIENDYGEEYRGQTVLTELAADAESCEALQYAVKTVLDGEEALIYTASFEYDTPEPMACRNLRAGFERTSENMMTVNFVVDPGSEQEFTRTLTIPENSDCGVIPYYIPIAIFNDPDCETLTHWDRKSDASFYIFTNPSDELVGKYQALMTKLRVEAAQADPEAFLKNVISANAWEEINSRHGSLFVRSEYEDGYVSSVYLTNDYACDLDSGALYDAEDNWRYVDVNGENVFSLDWYAMSEEERGELIWKPEHLFPRLAEDFLLKEQIADLAVNEDGTLTLTLGLNAEDLAAIQESLGNSLPEDCAGMEYMSVFTLAPETLELLTLEEYTILGEEKTRLVRTEIEYDAEQPEQAAEMLALAEDFRTSEPEDARTITVVYHAGSDEEERFSVSVDNKYRVVPFLREGFGLFSDPEGTELFPGSDEAVDRTLYAVYAEESAGE